MARNVKEGSSPEGAQGSEEQSDRQTRRRSSAGGSNRQRQEIMEQAMSNVFKIAGSNNGVSLLSEENAITQAEPGWGGALTINRDGSAPDRPSVTRAKPRGINEGGVDGQAHGSSGEDERRRARMTAQSFKMMQMPSVPLLGSDEDNPDWKLAWFGIGVGLNAMEPSAIIHPFSPFAQALTLISTSFLSYVAIVTPVMVAYYWSMEDCWRSPTLEFDMLMDTFFMVEICLTFFIGIHEKGKYHDRRREVAVHYLTSGHLFFDIVTSVPVSYLEFVSAVNCMSDPEAAAPDELALLRVIKPLRLLKMIRILKTMKFSKIIAVIQRYVRPPVIVIRLFTLLLCVLYMVHVTACVYWITKELSSTDEEISIFLNRYLEGAGERTENVLNVAPRYVLSTYFISSIFTTVGFGDIHAENIPEMVLCIVVMYMGTFIFGSLLSEVETAVESIRHTQRQKNQIKQQVSDYLTTEGVPSYLQDRIVDWVEFNYVSTHKQTMQDNCMALIPSNMKPNLLGNLHNGKLRRHPVLKRLRAPGHDRFLNELWGRMKTVAFCEDEMLADGSTEATCLYFIQLGRVRVMDINNQNKVTTLERGDFVGAHSIFGNPIWGYELGVACDFIAESNVQCSRLTIEEFEAVLSNADPEVVEEVDEYFRQYTLSDEQMEDIFAPPSPLPSPGAEMSGVERVSPELINSENNDKEEYPPGQLEPMGSPELGRTESAGGVSPSKGKGRAVWDLLKTSSLNPQEPKEELAAARVSSPGEASPAGSIPRISAGPSPAAELSGRGKALWGKLRTRTVSVPGIQRTSSEMQQEGAEFRRRTTLAYSAAGVDKLLPGGSMSGSVSVPPPPSDTSLGQDEPKSDEDAERATWRNRNLPNPTGELLLEIQRQESGGSTPGGGVSLVTMGKVQSEIEQVLAEQATQSHAIAELTAGQATLKQEVRATLRGVEQILATMQAMQATQATNSTPVFSPGTPGTPSAAFARTPSGHLRGVASGLLVSATASRYLSGASLQGGADLREEWDGTEGRGTPG